MRLLPACLVLGVSLAPAEGRQAVYDSIELACGQERDRPVQIAWTADGSALMVVHEETGDVSFLAPEFETAVSVGNGPLDIELVPLAPYALVPCSLDDTLVVLDPGARAVVATIPLSGVFPYQVEVASTGDFAVVACAGDNSLSVVDLASFTETASWATADLGPFVPINSTFESPYYGGVDAYPVMDLGTDDRTLALPCGPAYTVEVCDVTTGGLLSSADISAVPTAVVVGGGSRYVGILAIDVYLYVLDTFTDQVASYEPCFMDCFWFPSEQGLALDASGTAMIAATFDKLVVLDLATATPLLEDYAVGPALGISHDGKYALSAASKYGNQLVVTDIATGAPSARLTGVSADRIAMHPTRYQAALLDTLQSETVDWVDFGPGQVTHLRNTPTGPHPQADGPCRVATDRYGERIVTANYRSNGISIVDVRTGVTRCVPTGRRPYKIDVDDAGRVAVVAHRDQSVAVVNLDSGKVAAELEGIWAADLIVDPAGRQAYVLDVTAEELYIVALDGPASHVATTFPMPDLAWIEGLALSKDGILGVATWLESKIPLVDTRTHTLLQEIDTESQCERVVFAPDGPWVYAITGGHARKWEFDGKTSSKKGKAAILNPARLAISGDGKWLYVSTDYSYPTRFVVVDTETMKVRSTHEASDPIDLMVPAGRDVFLYRRSTAQIQRMRIGDDGTAVLAEVIDPPHRPLSLLPGPYGRLYSIPDRRDGLDVFTYPYGHQYCDALPNSTGQPGVLRALGWPAAGHSLDLVADDLPPGEVATFFVGDAQVSLPFESGKLCVGGAAGRFRGADPVIDPAGRVTAVADTESLAGTFVVQPGEVWHFQTWFRDHVPEPTSNFTDAVSVLFQ